MWGFPGTRAEAFQTQKVFVDKNSKSSDFIPDLFAQGRNLMLQKFLGDLLKVLMAESNRNG